MVFSCEILYAKTKIAETIGANVDSHTQHSTHIPLHNLDKFKHSETDGICNSLVKSQMGGRGIQEQIGFQSN